MERIFLKKIPNIIQNIILSNLSIFGTHPEKNQKKPTQYVRRVGTPTQNPYCTLYNNVMYENALKISGNASCWNFSFPAFWRVEVSASLGTRKKGPPFPPSSGLNHEHY